MKHLLKLSILIIVLVGLFVSCCENKHFLSDRAYREKVHQQFVKRTEQASNRSQALFSVFDRDDITVAEQEALEFLYAYMPLCDLADYDGEFFLKQVRIAFQARDYFDWGRSVPEDLFRHFVLVYRINNEYLDDSREVFFNELKVRVKGMTMEEAALEVNHWCHEKVTYKGTDGRTSAPLALVKTSWGRCGEEATFTAAAMRAIGIPARQCYTPRWAHTDDNHAWVEVWIDGKWHYLGACEPEPELNVAWFSAPAKRTMMVHTNVFGMYMGPEEKNFETDLYSRINLLSNYAQTRKITVNVVDKQQRSVEGAIVKFKLYNYAELYPLSETLTKENGRASVTTGMGDLMIWANKGDAYGYAKCDVANNTVTVELNSVAGEKYDETYTMEVPAEQRIEGLSAEKIEKNALRLSREDSIRNAYMNTFATESYAGDIAFKNKLDKEQVWKYLKMSQGNWKEISSFIESGSSNHDLFPFLASLLEKDLRDTPAAILNDHFPMRQKVNPDVPESLRVTKVVSPRLALELIRPWRTYFLGKMVSRIPDLPSMENGQQIVDYVKNNIIISEENYYSCMITPQGVDELKVADKRSRNIYFVALCRTMGIAAQIEQATGKPQYYESGKWVDAIFEDVNSDKVAAKGELILNNDPQNIIKPGYEAHFTIAVFKNGDFQTLDLYGDPALKSFPSKLTLDAGYYRILVGSRANDGSVTISTQYFTIEQGELYSAVIRMPEVKGKLFVKGIVDMNTLVTLNDKTAKSLKELSSGKGLVICFADPDKEPTKHILQELPTQGKEFEQWGGGILFMVPHDKISASFNPAQYAELPSQLRWGIDNKRTLLNSAAGALGINFTNNFPLVVYLSSNGGILFSTEGYRIGISEDLIKTIRMEAATKKK